MKIWGSVPGRQNSTCKGCKIGQNLVCQRTIKMNNVTDICVIQKVMGDEVEEAGRSRITSDVGGDGKYLIVIMKIMGSLMRGIRYCDLSSRKISFPSCFFLVRSHLSFKSIFRIHFSQLSLISSQTPIRFCSNLCCRLDQSGFSREIGQIGYPMIRIGSCNYED